MRTLHPGHPGALFLAALLCLAALLAAGIPAARGQSENGDEEVVYIGQDGVIRVWDPTPVNGREVQWVSPSAGWIDLALGDFNADGDFEIVAIGADGATGKLAVFDPVVVGPAPNPDQVINGIPWDTLYAVNLPGIPSLVATGEFDTARPGHEIIYKYLLPVQDRVKPDDPFRFVILRAAAAQPDGRSWNVLTTQDTGNDWTQVAAGNLDGSGIDEIALVDRERGNLSVYRVTANGFERFYRNSAQERPWQAVAFGQFLAGGPAELLAVRSADSPLANLLAFQYVADTLDDFYSRFFLPPPKFVFLADVDGDGDDEAAMLRVVRPEFEPRARLFIRSNNRDDWMEDTLDADNGYRVGAGGDVDGDGRDELVIMRDNRLRLYTQPEIDVSRVEREVGTNEHSIQIANLDANGVGDRPRLGAAPTTLSVELVANAESDPYGIAVSDVTTGSAVPISARLESSVAWISSLSLSRDATPTTVEVRFNARDLPLGTHTTRLIVEAEEAGVDNSPLFVNLTLTVRPGLILDPESLNFHYVPCGPNLPAQTQALHVGGTAGLSYAATITDEAAWLELDQASGTTPGTVLVTVNPNDRPADFVSTGVRVVASTEQGVVEQVAQVNLLCAASQIFLPVIAR